MPLVTLTCSDKLYPVDDPGAHQGVPHVVVGLARELPLLITDHGAVINPVGVPEAGVQVDIRKFHSAAVNNVDLWIHVQLTEDPGDEDARLRVRETLKTIISDFFTEYGLTNVSWALDIFFGPGHGCFTDSAGNIAEEW